jgi:hypothetical protein
VLAANTDQGIDKVAEQLLNVIFPTVEDGLSKKYISVGRRLVEILESRPDKEVLISFLRSHVSRTGRYLEWGGVSVMEKYQLYDSVFDAYAPYVGHGMNFTLVNFTDVWDDPFETNQEGVPKIRETISSAISSIELIQHRFNHDLKSQEQIKDWLASLSAFYRERPNLFENVMPQLQFFVYAGRRSEIDASPARHDMWSQLRNYRDYITVKTYDNLIDAFL